MSSVPKIAVAPSVAPTRAEPPSVPRHLKIVPRPDALLNSALEADARRSAPLKSLSNVWLDHVAGRLRFAFESTHPDRVLLVSRENRATCNLTRADAFMLLRLLCGEQQKVLSLELGVAVSTLSSRYNRSLVKLGLARGELPLSLVLAAQCAANVANISCAWSASFERLGARYEVVRIPAPDTRNITALTHAEQQVARWIIEGCSRREIGDRRGTSVHTASSQFHSIFATLQASGRCALIRAAFELGCFAPAG